MAHHHILLFRRQSADFGSATSSVERSFIADKTVNQHDTGAPDEFAEGWRDFEYESDRLFSARIYRVNGKELVIWRMIGLGGRFPETGYIDLMESANHPRCW